MSKFKSSKFLSKSENAELEFLESLLYAAPLSNSNELRYVELIKKAHRKSHLNPLEA